MASFAAFRRVLCLPGVQYIATRFGGPALRRWSFDEKFRTGQWDFSGEASRELAEAVERYAEGGDILMLGCGTAAITSALKPGCFNSFLGVDLSEEAVARANLRANDKIRFELGDMLHFKTAQKFNVILFSESLYYLKSWQRKPMLGRSVEMLRPTGHIIVTISQPARFARVLNMMRKNFSILEDRAFSDSQRHLLVLRGKAT